jgi:two-component system, chemotaxis family, chemotaxis protein CheY
MKVLVVDDHNIFRKMTIKMVKDTYEVYEGKNGKEGLALAQSNNDIELILTDVNMPEMTGLDMVEEIRKIAGYENTPVIVLTSERDQALIDRASSLNVHHWLPKPFKKDQLLEAIGRIGS